MSGRVRTEAQKAAAKRKHAENADATKKASQKWRAQNPDIDKAKKGHDTSSSDVDGALKMIGGTLVMKSVSGY